MHLNIDQWILLVVGLPPFIDLIVRTFWHPHEARKLESETNRNLVETTTEATKGYAEVMREMLDMRTEMTTIRGEMDTLQKENEERKNENASLRNKVTRMTDRIQYLMGVIAAYTRQMAEHNITPCEEVQPWSVDGAD